jgi:hypothetical protein
MTPERNSESGVDFVPMVAGRSIVIVASAAALLCLIVAVAGAARVSKGRLVISLSASGKVNISNAEHRIVGGGFGPKGTRVAVTLPAGRYVVTAWHARGRCSSHVLVRPKVARRIKVC